MIDRHCFSSDLSGVRKQKTSVLFACIAACLIPAFLMAAAPAENTPSVLVQTTRIEKGSLPKTVAAYGTVEANPSAQKSIMSPLSAIVDALYVRLGDEVPKGAPLVRLSPNPQTGAAYAQAASALQAANASVRHTQQLFDEKLATNQQLADAKNAQSAARAALMALQAQGASGSNVIRAPFQAIVTSLSTNAGSLVPQGGPLLSLARPSGLVLRVGVVPSQAIGIKPGDKTEVTAVGEGRTLTGQVISGGSIVDTGTGLVPVTISLPPGYLLPGETAQATITTGTVRGYVVPHDAVLADDKGNPYVVQAVHMVARIVHVRVLDTNGNRDTVDGKLDASAPLVLAGSYQLQDGMRVRFSDPAVKSGK